MSQRNEHTLLMQTTCHIANNTLYSCILHVTTQRTFCTYADSMSQRYKHTLLMQTPCHNGMNTLYLCRLHAQRYEHTVVYLCRLHATMRWTHCTYAYSMLQRVEHTVLMHTSCTMQWTYYTYVDSISQCNKRTVPMQTPSHNAMNTMYL